MYNIIYHLHGIAFHLILTIGFTIVMNFICIGN